MPSTTAIDPVMMGLMEKMRLRSAEIAAYLRGSTTQRQWMMPAVNEDPLSDAWDGDLTDLAGIADGFDRRAVTEAYVEALHTGSSGKAAACNLQIAYMAMMERSFRARHKTPCRSIAHAAGRRRGHGEEGGVHEGQVIQFIQDLLVSGSEVA